MTKISGSIFGNYDAQAQDVDVHGFQVVKNGNGPTQHERLLCDFVKNKPKGVAITNSFSAFDEPASVSLSRIRWGMKSVKLHHLRIYLGQQPVLQQ